MGTEQITVEFRIDDTAFQQALAAYDDWLDDFASTQRAFGVALMAATRSWLPAIQEMNVAIEDAQMALNQVAVYRGASFADWPHWIEVYLHLRCRLPTPWAKRLAFIYSNLNISGWAFWYRHKATLAQVTMLSMLVVAFLLAIT